MILLEQYQKFQTLKNPTTQQILAHICGLTMTQVKKMKQKESEKKLAEINQFFSEDHKLSNIIEIDGKEFGFIPNLDDITFGENLDLNNYLGDWGNMHKAMAVLYRPVTSKLKNLYEIEEYEGSAKYSETMKHLPLECVLGAMVFFYNLMNDLLNCFPKYIHQAAKQPDMKKGLHKNGRDLDSYINYVKEISEDLKQFQNINFLNV